MTEININYVKPDNNLSGFYEYLCFACAIKEVLAGTGDDIHIESDDYSGRQCAICSSFIKDKILI